MSGPVRDISDETPSPIRIAAQVLEGLGLHIRGAQEDDHGRVLRTYPRGAVDPTPL